MERKEQILEQVYTDPKHPASFSNIRNLYLASKKLDPSINLSDVRNYLNSQDSYTLYGVNRKNFYRRAVYIEAPNVIAGSDLADFTNLAEFNDGFKYVLIIIDCFSRKLDMAALPDKSGNSVSKALDGILSKHILKPHYIWVDRGSDFYNNNVRCILEKFKIKLYSTENYQTKSVFAERVIRTVRSQVTKYLTFFNTKRYIDFLSDIIRNYNSSPHRGILFKTPNEIHYLTDKSKLKKLAKDIFNIKFKNYSKNTGLWRPLLSYKNELKKGTHVRIRSVSSDRSFRKEADELFSREIFRIRAVIYDTPILYKLEDLSGELISGYHYREELKVVNLPIEFPIEKILSKKKTPSGKTMFLVKWLHYPEKFNSYISGKDLKLIQSNV